MSWVEVRSARHSSKEGLVGSAAGEMFKAAGISVNPDPPKKLMFLLLIFPSCVSALFLERLLIYLPAPIQTCDTVCGATHSGWGLLSLAVPGNENVGIAHPVSFGFLLSQPKTAVIECVGFSLHTLGGLPSSNSALNWVL